MPYPPDDNAPPKPPVAGTRSGPPMRLSSPMPWLLAIVLSLPIWAVIGWLLWRFFHG